MVAISREEGRLGPLAGPIRECPFDAVESFSLPRMGGDLPPAEARSAWPGKASRPNFTASLCYQPREGIADWMAQLASDARGLSLTLQFSEDIPTRKWQGALRIVCGIEQEESPCPSYGRSPLLLPDTVTFAPEALGEWSWTVRSEPEDPGLAGRGSFECVASKLHGPLRVSADNPLWFTFADGTPVYIMCFHLWRAEALNKETLSSTLDYLRKRGFNAIDGPHLGADRMVWERSPDGKSDFSRFDLAVWANLDHLVEQLAQREMLIFPFSIMGGTNRLPAPRDPAGTNGSFECKWLDPRSGDRHAGGTVAGGARREVRAPDETDWVLTARKLAPRSVGKE